MLTTFPNKILNPIVLQWDFHEGIFLTPTGVPVAGKAFHLGVGCLIMPSCIGGPLFQEINYTVIADNFPVVSQDHTAGNIQPHLNIVPFTPVTPNLLIPILVTFSENTCKFAVSSVVGPQGEIAVSIFKWVGLNWGCNDLWLKKGSRVLVQAPVKKAASILFGRAKVFMNQYARPISILCNILPTAIVINSGTVVIGFTLSDLIRVIVSIVLDMIINKILGISKKLIPKGIKKYTTLGIRFRNLKGQFDSINFAKLIIENLFEKGISALQEVSVLENFLDGYKLSGKIMPWIDNNSETLPAEN